MYIYVLCILKSDGFYPFVVVVVVFQYEKAASVLSSHDPPVALAKVDANAEENKGLAEKFEIQGFPTIKILKNGGEVVQDYKGPREADGIVEYLKKQVGPASFEIATPEDASKLIDEKKVFVVRLLHH